MFCDKCGSKVNDNDIYCPVCSNKIDHSKNSNKILRDIIIRFNLAKKKIVVLGVLAVLVIGGTSFYKSSGGKYFIAGLLAENGHYNAAYNMVSSISSEKADTKQTYYKLLMDVRAFIDGEAEVYAGGDTTGGYRAINDDEVDKAVYGAGGDGVCTIEDFNNIADEVISISGNENYLSNGEQSRYEDIKKSVDRYYEKRSGAESFEGCAYDAYGIYDIAEFFKDGGRYDPAEMKEEIQDLDSKLASARQIYNEYISYDFYGYSDIAATIDRFIKSMDNALAEFGEGYGIYFTELTYDEPPYDRDEITYIKDNLYLHIAKSCFDSDMMI